MGIAIFWIIVGVVVLLVVVMSLNKLKTWQSSNDVEEKNRKVIYDLILEAKENFYKDRNISIENFKRIVSEFPKSKQAPYAQYMLGRCYEQSYMWQSAINCFEKITEEYAGCDREQEAYYAIGECYEKLSKWSKAIEVYEKYLEKYPQGDWVYHIKRRIDEIKATQLRSAKKIDYKSESTKLFEEANSLFQKNKDLAIIKLKEYIDRYGNDPNVTLAFLGVAQCYQDLDNCVEAINAYLEYIHRFPTDGMVDYALFMVGYCYERQKNLLEAKLTYEQLMERFPSSWFVEGTPASPFNGQNCRDRLVKIREGNV